MELWVFEDTAGHAKRTGGVHTGDIKVHGSGTAHVKDCKFSVYLFKAGSDEYHHKTFTDCKITDITIFETDH